MIRRRYIRERVAKLLGEHGITSAPVEVVSLAQAMGIEVYQANVDESQSGFLYRGEDGRAVIGVNASHHPVRQRFTIAHELGHYVLHGSEPVHYDDTSKGFQVRLRNDLSSEGVDRHEIEANTFAAELLMPAGFLEADVRGGAGFNIVENDPEFDRLKDLYQVSRRAMAIRLSQLGYIAELP